MVEGLFITTGVVIIAAALFNYQRTRDPLAPMVIFAPILLYFYAYHPLVMLQNPELPTLVGPVNAFTTTAIVNLLGVSAFCVGCVMARRSRRFAAAGGNTAPGDAGHSMAASSFARSRESFLTNKDIEFTNRGRGQVYMIALTLGLVSVSVFWYLIWNSGGFVKVFMSGGKPFLRGGGSGYIGELPMLSFPAMLLIAVARQGRRFRFVDFAAYIFAASPQIIWATLGGRRGPMFLLAMSLAASWMIVRSKRPKLTGVLAGLMAVGLLIVFLAATRQSLFLGSDKEFSFTDFTSQFTTGTEIVYGDEFVCGYAAIEVARQYQRHYWGHRFLVQLFVRPIPRQIWSTKYQDTGMEWMDEKAGSSGFEQSEWLRAVGFEPTGGSSTGFVADLFLEFSWGAILGCFLLGWFYSTLWKKSHTRGGFWTVLYYLSLILSIYLVAQSVISAWGYRMLLLGVPTWFIWRKIIDPHLRHRQQIEQEQAMFERRVAANLESDSLTPVTSIQARP